MARHKWQIVVGIIIYSNKNNVASKSLKVWEKSWITFKILTDIFNHTAPTMLL
jgi:hypothetical protein